MSATDKTQTTDWNKMTSKQRDKLSIKRIENIKASGRARALAGLPPRPEYAGRELGQAESCIFYDGYAEGKPTFKNPYRFHHT